MTISHSTEFSESRNSSAVPLLEISRVYAKSPLSYLGPRRKHDTGVPQLSGADHATPRRRCLYQWKDDRQGLREDECVCHFVSGPCSGGSQVTQEPVGPVQSGNSLGEVTVGSWGILAQ